MENDIVPCEIPERLTVTLTARQIRALFRIHEYLYADEERSWKASSPEGRENHIFEAAQTLYMMLEDMLYNGPFGLKSGKKP
jgi:hypothetical protein